jgi:hypothetical protein
MPKKPVSDEERLDQMKRAVAVGLSALAGPRPISQIVKDAEGWVLPWIEGTAYGDLLSLEQRSSVK